MPLTQKEIKQRHFDKLYAEAPLIDCACGCGQQLKAIDKYARSVSYINGHNGRKYSDPKQYKREWKTRNKSQVQAYDTMRRAELKQAALTAYGGKCSCCGETEFEFLAIDHVNGDGAAHRKLIKRNSIYSVLKKDNYPDTFQILCMNCNWSSYIGKGICKHKR